MIAVNNLSVHFGGDYLFDSLNFSINPRDCIGLIGRNGTGKTTLIKILAGLDFPEEGIIAKPNDMTIGYLPQEGHIESNKNVFEETKSALVEIVNLELEIKRITDEIQHRTDTHSEEYLKLLKRLADSNERFHLLGGHSIEAEIEKVLRGLGFDSSDLTRMVGEFSGGWQMRIELAKILLRKPDCIFLDEPTNHLDIESIQWLEGFLKNYPGAILIVSHDRSFLDNVTNRTMQLFGGNMYDFNLPYTEFMKVREEQKKQQESAYKNQQRQIAQTERFIERFRSKATLASRVQSRIKQLDKIDRIELEEEDTSAIKIRFAEPPRSARVMAETKGLSKSYGTKHVLENIDFAIERGEKVAFVGRNGEGKSTLSKILAGIENYDGTLEIGTNTNIGYYAQHQAELLNDNLTVFEVIDFAAKGEMRLQIRKILGAFLFSGDSVDKKVKVLSGGEKSRLALALLLLNPYNLLILDEPTNHLDMKARDVLKDALINYQGSLILVSHDRHFLHELTTRTYYFKDKKIKEYLGDIYEFLDKYKMETLRELEYNKANTVRTNDTPSRTKLDREQKKAFERDERKLKRAIEELEKEIEKIESAITELEDEFASSALHENIELLKSKQAEYNSLKATLEAKMEEWSQLHEELEKLVELFNNSISVE